MSISDDEGPVPERWTRSTVYEDMWVDPDDDPRESGGEAVDERGILLDYLRTYRLTMEMKCADLDAEQLARRSVPPSTMSLLGLLRHMAEDERHVRRVMAGEDAPPLYRTADDRDGDWNGAAPPPPSPRPPPRPGAAPGGPPDPAVVEDAWRQWRAEAARTDEYAAGVGDLGSRNVGVSDLGPDGADLSWREMLVAHITEYARHCGHADLLRERVDGRVGQ